MHLKLHREYGRIMGGERGKGEGNLTRKMGAAVSQAGGVSTEAALLAACTTLFEDAGIFLCRASFLAFLPDW